MNLLKPHATDGFVDLQFALAGDALPSDYADALWCAVRDFLPWLEDDAFAGIHPISGLSPGAGLNEWYLSRRARLTLRLAGEQVDEARALVGAHLRLATCYAVEVGSPQVRHLTHSPVLYSKFVTFKSAGESPLAEEDFLSACRAELSELGVAPQLICGKPQTANTGTGSLAGFSLVLFDLKADAALLLQRRGLGVERKRGCGIFVPHKSMGAVGTLE